jgi:hypothetical protein
VQASNSSFQDLSNRNGLVDGSSHGFKNNFMLSILEEGIGR